MRTPARYLVSLSAMEEPWDPPLGWCPECGSRQIMNEDGEEVCPMCEESKDQEDEG